MVPQSAFIVFACVVALGCGGARETSRDSEPHANAPKKLSVAHVPSTSDSPRKLSKAEQKAMGIEQRPSQVRSSSSLTPRDGLARDACSKPSRPVLPGRAVSIPLVHPLLGASFSIDACLVGDRRAATRYIVDSGADLTTVRERDAHQAGLTPRATGGYMLDANGVRQARREVEPQVLQVGNLQVAKPGLTVADNSALLGQDILNKFQSWMLDHDHGLLRLGMRPPSRGFITRAPLQRIGSLPGNFIQVRIAGRSFLMKLDTGAFSTSISREVADELRLPKRSGRPSTEVTYGVHSQTIVRSSYKAKIEVGSLAFEDVEVMPLPSAPQIHYNQTPGSKLRGPSIPVVGLLGADVLLQHNIVVRPHKDISFYKREPTETTAAQRLTRWSWVPVCKDGAGCARAQIASRNPRRVSLTIDRGYPQSAQFVFACVNRAGQVNDSLPYLLLSHPKPQRGKVSYSVQYASKRTFRDWSAAVRAKHCRALRLVDVQEPPPGRVRKSAALVPSARFWLR